MAGGRDDRDRRDGTAGSGRGRAGAGGAGATDAGKSGRSGLSEARRYTPRGRTVRESSRDPFRPALEVIDGGRRAGGRATAPTKAAPPKAAPEPPENPPPKALKSVPEPAERRAPVRKAPVRKAPVKKVPVKKAARKAPHRTLLARAAHGRTGKPRALKRYLDSAQAPPRIAEPRRRLRLATVIMVAMFLVVAGRLVQLQLVDASAYAAEGLKNRLTTDYLPAPRGAILDADGNILVHSVEARYVSADPTLVADPDKTADALFAVLGEYGVLRSDLVRKLSPHKTADGKTKVRFEYLARGINISDGDKISALHLNGVDVNRDERRDVPGNDLASNILGFIGKGDNHKGLTGVEAAYDSVLRGVDGKRTYEIGGGDLGKEIPGGVDLETPAHPGSSVELTINRDLQYEVQSDLAKRMSALKATFGSAVVMDVKTGEVVAQASYPAYDAADPFSYDASSWKDQSTQTVFDPGSIHKALMVAGALQEGLIKPDSTVVVGPSINKGGVNYHDSHMQMKDTPMTLPGILALSSNVGTIKIADLLGKDKVVEYQKKFGLGQPTGEGLGGEAPGDVLPANKWTGTDPGSVPIGNGVATTGIQMAAAYAAIANNGVWVQPHLVKATIAPNGKVTAAPAPKTHRVIDANVASELRTMLEGVTTLDEATGKQAAVQGYRIAGKTGTSELVEDGKYTSGTVTSFIGMAPADAPRFVVAVNAHVPADSSGGAVAAPAFHDMMTYTLVRYGVLPTGTPPPKLTIYP
jgi:cell division protein FtsI (penicillin-binding protein 3)